MLPTAILFPFPCLRNLHKGAFLRMELTENAGDGIVIDDAAALSSSAGIAGAIWSSRDCGLSIGGAL